MPLSDDEKQDDQMPAGFEAQHLAAIVDSSDDAIIGKMLDGTILSWNRSAEVLYGFSEKETLGQNISIIFPKEHSEDILHILKKIRLGQPVSHYETVQKHADGHLLHVSLSVSPIQDSNGIVIGASSIARDITARKKIEQSLSEYREELLAANEELTATNQELQASETELATHRDKLEELVAVRTKQLLESETRLRSTLDSMMEGCQIIDKEWRYLYVNDSAASQGKKAKEELLGKTMMEIYPGIENTALFDILRQSMESKTHNQLVNEFIFSDGSKGRFELIIEPVPEGIFMLSFDITERKRSIDLIDKQSHEITEANRQLNREISGRRNAEDTLSTRNEELAVAGEELKTSEGELQVADEELRQQNAELISKQDALGKSEEKYRRIVETAQEGIWIMNESGMTTFVNSRMAAMLGQDTAEVIGKSFYSFLNEETRQKLEEMKTHRDQMDKNQVELELLRSDGKRVPVQLTTTHIFDQKKRFGGVMAMVTDITIRKQLEERIQQSQKMEALGQLAGGIAHDFNNLLAVIMGNAELLQLEHDDKTPDSEHVLNIVKTAQHAGDLTKQLLSFARKGQYRLITFDIHQTIREVINILNNTIDRRIKIKHELNDTSSAIIGDPAQIENALLNLGLNARDAMPEGGELVFSTELVYLDSSAISPKAYKIEPGQYLKISVRDTGIGMSDDIKDKIFEPFFTTKGPGKGTGLGLASVYGIVKNHNGYIEVESTEGKGSVMQIYLPAASAADIKKAKEEQLRFDLVKGNILFIEDEEGIRETACQMLLNVGYTVTACKDGVEGIEYFKTNHSKIDCVILDMIMPRKDGRETFLELKKIKPKVKVLLSTGFSADGEAREMLNKGVLGFIQKPYKFNDLVAKINEVLLK